MNIVWHNWRSVLAEVAASQGYDLDLQQVEAPAARRYAQAVNAALEIAWKFYAWPACCWVINGADVSPVDVCERGFDVLAYYAEDPLAAWTAGTDPKVISLRETQGRHVAVGDAQATPFWLVRTAPPRFGTAARSTSTAYQVGDLIYDSATGEAWRCALAHTNQAPEATWDNWKAGTAYTDTAEVWRNGILYGCTDAHTSAVATNEPGYGASGSSFWDAILYWAPQRVPSFLLQAVIHGARAWLHESPPLPRSALEKQMEGWLAAEVDDLRYNRKQRFANGGGLTIL